MPKPACVCPSIRDANEPANGTIKSAARYEIFHRRAVSAGVEIEIQNLIPHGRKKTQMPLLPRVLLCDFQLNRLARFLKSAKERRDWFTRLEIDRSILNLDDDVVCKLAVERMKNIIGSSGAIALGIVPVKMMVIDKGPVENDSGVRLKGMRDRVGCHCGRPAVGRGTCPALRVRFYDKSAEIGNLPVNLVNFLAPPFRNARIQRIKRIQASDPFGAAQIDGNRQPDAPRAKHIGDANELRKKAVFQNAWIGVDIIDGAPIDPDGGKQTNVITNALQVRTNAAILEKDRSPGISALNPAV